MTTGALVLAAADLRSEFRRPEESARLLLVVLAGAVLVGAGMGLGPAASEALPALLWLLLLLAALLAGPGEPSAIEGLLAAGLPPASLLLGRVLSVALLLALGGALLYGLLLLFLGNPYPGNLALGLGVVLLGAAGLATASTPVALLLLRSRARGGLLPLLATPLLLPFLLAAVAGLRKALLGLDPAPEALFLLAYTLAVGLLSHRIAEHVLEVE